MDKIGILSSLYKFSKFAYVGGGMGNKGLHNTLEAAVFGIPIIIGKNFQRYPEAIEMVKLGGCCLFQQKMNLKILGKTNKK